MMQQIQIYCGAIPVNYVQLFKTIITSHVDFGRWIPDSFGEIKMGW